MWTPWTILKQINKKTNIKSHTGPHRFSLPYQHFCSKRKKQNKRVFFAPLFMFPCHLCVERLPVIWGEMLNGGVFSLQQESQNKTTNTSLAKTKQKWLLLLPLTSRRIRSRVAVETPAPLTLERWRTLLESRRIFPEFSEWTECTSVDVLRTAESLHAVLVQCLRVSVDATWRHS